MVFDIYNLSHIFHLVSHSLAAVISKMDTATSWSEATDTWWKILVLRRLAMPFDGIQVELVLIGSAAYASLVHLMGHLLISWVLFLGDAVHRVIDHIRRVAKLIVVTSAIVNIHRMRLGRSNLILTRWRVYLHIISTSLWTPLDLILNLLGLLFVGLADRNALTNLLLLGSVQRMHLLMWVHHHSAFIWRITILLLHLGRRIHVDVGIIDSTVSRIPFGRAWPISTLSRSITLGLSRFLGAWWNRSSRGQLLLLHHLALNLLLVQLLRWRQIKVVNDVCNICHSVIILAISLMGRVYLLASR